jgi:hypothetical protein
MVIWLTHFLGVFSKPRKDAICCVLSVYLSVGMEKGGTRWTEFHKR